MMTFRRNGWRYGTMRSYGTLSFGATYELSLRDIRASVAGPISLLSKMAVLLLEIPDMNGASTMISEEVY